MSMTDPIADFLARIRNGIRARKQLVECPRSIIKLRIAEGFADLKWDVKGFRGTVERLLPAQFHLDGKGIIKRKGAP